MSRWWRSRFSMSAASPEATLSGGAVSFGSFIERSIRGGPQLERSAFDSCCPNRAISKLGLPKRRLGRVEIQPETRGRAKKPEAGPVPPADFLGRSIGVHSLDDLNEALVDLRCARE